MEIAVVESSARPETVSVYFGNGYRRGLVSLHRVRA